VTEALCEFFKLNYTGKIWWKLICCIFSSFLVEIIRARVLFRLGDRNTVKKRHEKISEARNYNYALRKTV
jgi:hypothetical protein